MIFFMILVVGALFLFLHSSNFEYISKEYRDGKIKASEQPVKYKKPWELDERRKRRY